ncbi:MAG: DUF2220 domain-containing protein, partial [bacterium]|nr:DUF2220 domain-containing protein [bacterium]
LEPQCRYVVIVENQMTYLTLPSMESAMAIYGGGFKVENLKDADWLKGKIIIYWGDIDAHGFLILSLLRRSYPGVVSIMMEEETFLRFPQYYGKGSGSLEMEEEGLNLTPGEFRIYMMVNAGNLRLEQEHLPQYYMAEQFRKLMEETSWQE